VPAFVEHAFRGGFLLDETRLRKLKDIIESRETRGSDSKMLYRVYRGDSYSYETASVDDVVNEDWRRITRLDLRISRPEPEGAKKDDFCFLLTFSDKEGCAQGNVSLPWIDAQPWNNDIRVVDRNVLLTAL
jgi:hypothetical protein